MKICNCSVSLQQLMKSYKNITKAGEETMTKKTITKRTWKLLLGICIAAVLSIGIGLFAYIHMIDTKTLGRKISIYGLDV